MIDTLIYVAIGLAAIAVVVEFLSYRRNATVDLPRLWQTLDNAEKAAQANQQALRDDMSRHGEAIRSELSKLRQDEAAAAEQARAALANSLESLAASLNQNFTKTAAAIDLKLQQLQEATGKQSADAAAVAKQSRDEIAKSLTGFNDALTKSIAETAKAQQAQLGDFSARLDKAAAAADQRVAGLDAKLKTLQDDSAKKSDLLQAAVDAKLQSAEKRLADAFRQSADRAEQAIARIPAPKQS